MSRRLLAIPAVHVTIPNGFGESHRAAIGTNRPQSVNYSTADVSCYNPAAARENCTAA
jgi:hypothetical protein